MIKSLYMKKTTEYLYIFTKLSASIILLILVILLFYLLINSYKKVDIESSNLSSQFHELTNQITDNEKSIINIFNKTQESFKNLSEHLKNHNDSDEIKTIRISVNKLNLKINEIISLNNQLQKKQQPIKIKESIEDESNYQLRSLIKLISIKFKNGENIEEEILLLDSFVPINKKYLLNKLFLIELSPFYGFSNLKKEFEQSIKLYTKNNFLLKNQNNILKFIFKIIDIKPGNLTRYKSEELNILMRAKGYMDLGNLKKSLDQIMLISDYNKFFLLWIKQIKIYIEFNKILNEVGKID